MTGYATAEIAVKEADKAHNKTGKDFFVVVEAGRYDCVEEARIDTEFEGLPEDCVIYNTEEGWY
jgi:hypothetical protein